MTLRDALRMAIWCEAEAARYARLPQHECLAQAHADAAREYRQMVADLTPPVPVVDRVELMDRR